MKSSAVIASPLEKTASWRMWKVYVSPSAERSAGPTAMSGTSCTDWSNLYRPENTLRKMSTSVGDEMWAGSRSATSFAIGKLSVWSAASTSAGGGGVLGLQTATRKRAAM